jgi:hypothetical protein
MPDDTQPTTPALLGLTAAPGQPAVGAGLPELVRRMLADLVSDPEAAVIDALFPTAHDWVWGDDTLEVLHAPDGVRVRDVWYRRGDRLVLESRVADAR